jgi:hypothetical protein
MPMRKFLLPTPPCSAGEAKAIFDRLIADHPHAPYYAAGFVREELLMVLFASNDIARLEAHDVTVYFGSPDTIRSVTVGMASMDRSPDSTFLVFCNNENECPFIISVDQPKKSITVGFQTDSGVTYVVETL